MGTVPLLQVCSNTTISTLPLYLFLVLVDSITTKHYANMPVQYTAIFHGCKTIIFRLEM